MMDVTGDREEGKISDASDGNDGEDGPNLQLESNDQHGREEDGETDDAVGNGGKNGKSKDGKRKRRRSSGNHQGYFDVYGGDEVGASSPNYPYDTLRYSY